MCLSIKICKFLVSNLIKMSNFHTLEVVDRGSETQPQVCENLNRIIEGSCPTVHIMFQQCRIIVFDIESTFIQLANQRLKRLLTMKKLN